MTNHLKKLANRFCTICGTEISNPHRLSFLYPTCSKECYRELKNGYTEPEESIIAKDYIVVDKYRTGLPDNAKCQNCLKSFIVGQKVGQFVGKNKTLVWHWEYRADRHYKNIDCIKNKKNLTKTSITRV